MNDSIEVSREGLYEQVWSIPMTKLAERYGVTDVAMAKRCKRHNIPRPSRGYWAKIEAGQTPPKATLPEAPQNAVIVFERNAEERKVESNNLEVFDRDIDTILGRARALPQISVAPILYEPHPLVAQWVEHNHEKRKDRPTLRTVECVDISVNAPNVECSLRILDSLFKAIELVGGVVNFQNEEGYRRESRSLAISFSGQYVCYFRFRELTKRRPNGAYGFEYANKFVIDEGARYSNRILCRGSAQTLPEKLNQLIVDLVVEAGRRKLAAREAERVRRIEERTERRRKKKIARIRNERNNIFRLQKAERNKVLSLLKESADWVQAQSVRAYVAAVESRTTHRDQSLDQWLSWAKVQADRLDPLTPSPDSILDRPVPKLPRQPGEW